MDGGTRRIFKWTAITLTGIAVVLLLMHVLILPWIVRDQFNALLADAGIGGATFHVPVATLSTARITDLKFSGSDTRIDRITAQYGVGGIRRGQLSALRVTGLHLAITVDHAGKINLDPLDPLLRPKSTTRPASTRPRAQQLVPIERIELADSQVTITSPKQKLTLPLSGTAVGAEEYRYLLDFQTQLGSPVILSGTLTPQSGAMRLNLSADDADATEVTQLVTALAPNLGLGLRGRLKTRTSFEWDGKHSTLDAQFEAKPVADESGGGPNFQVSQGVFHIAGEFDDDRQLLRLTVRDAAFSERSQSVEASGVSGQIELTSLAPPRSPPNQRLRVQRLKVGETELTQGRLEFQVIDSQTIHVEHTEWSWLGGDVLAQDFTIKPDGTTVTLEARNLQLEQVLKQFAQGKAEGQATVSGELQLTLGKSGILFGKGHLSALPGGTLHVASAEDLADQIAPAVAARERKPEEVVRRNVAEALKDFEFTSLTADIEHQGAGLVGHVHITGHGRSGAKQAIDYALNVNGLDELITSVLHLREVLGAHDNGPGKAQP